ncbi:DUF4233 domain-containing protein [Microbispora sp. RL4-1S]|uniref:DUF4233 domain-containing protein n=1 Tax=Microbispora oryzae TaxID=2806554 RepID=A0A940WNM6_9ACTN|nr:DUF4233 domain-containing protein [Microbispora oryzae]MBP2706717.1 DUF4233 domain-containing protein [Microbispora oryzae]
MFEVTPGMRRLGASVLAMEAVVVALITPVAIQINDVAPALAVTVGLGLAVLCVVVTAMLKRPSAYIAGSVIQLLAIATGVLVPVMYVLGVIFAALWVTAIFVARRVEGATKR